MLQNQFRGLVEINQGDVGGSVIAGSVVGKVGSNEQNTDFIGVLHRNRIRMRLRGRKPVA